MCTLAGGGGSEGMKVPRGARRSARAMACTHGESVLVEDQQLQHAEAVEVAEVDEAVLCQVQLAARRCVLRHEVIGHALEVAETE